MLAGIAAIVFALALLFDLDESSGRFFNPTTFTIIGLLLLALHLAGFWSGYDWRAATRRGYSRRRRRR